MTPRWTDTPPPVHLGGKKNFPKKKFPKKKIGGPKFTPFSVAISVLEKKKIYFTVGCKGEMPPKDLAEFLKSPKIHFGPFCRKVREGINIFFWKFRERFKKKDRVFWKDRLFWRPFFFHGAQIPSRKIKIDFFGVRILKRSTFLASKNWSCEKCQNFYSSYSRHSGAKKKFWSGGNTLKHPEKLHRQLFGPV